MNINCLFDVFTGRDFERLALLLRAFRLVYRSTDFVSTEIRRHRAAVTKKPENRQYRAENAGAAA